MSEPMALDPSKTAILAMDYQKGIQSHVRDADALLFRAANLLRAGRAARFHVMYVVVAFRKGYPEISPLNKSFSAVRTTGRFLLETEETELPDVVAPRGDEIVIVKKRVSAFAGSDLETILRARSIDTLVLMGIATSGVVLSTLRHAADQDYRCIVIKDCCADQDDEVHRVLTEKVFPRQATVLTAQQFTDEVARLAT